MDLAFIVVPTEAVLAVAEDCVAADVGAVVIISGGFSESGPAGAHREAELAAVLSAAGIPMVGPNCAGMASLPAGVNAMGWPMRRSMASRGAGRLRVKRLRTPISPRRTASSPI